MKSRASKHARARQIEIDSRNSVLKTNLSRQEILSAGWMVCCFVVMCVIIALRITLQLDSDMSSELVLAKLLSEEKHILSSEWYYSTELRVLNTQLVFAPLFWMFNDWHTVRTVGTILLYGILLLSYAYFCKQAKISRTAFFLSSGFLFLPISSSYWEFILKGVYYIPHVSISFLAFGLLFQYRAEKRSKYVLLSMLLLAFLSGLGGLRQIFILYLPVLGTALILLLQSYHPSNPELTGLIGKKELKFLAVTTVLFLGAAFGYLYNSKILSKTFTFKIYDGIRYTKFSADRFLTIINDFLDFFGFQGNGLIFSASTLKNCFTFFRILLLIVSLISLCREKDSMSPERIISTFFLTSLLCFFALYCFTNADYTARYNIPLLIFALPIITIWGERKAAELAVYTRTHMQYIYIYIYMRFHLCPFARNTQYINLFRYMEAR